jgi:hypothetical protein
MQLETPAFNLARRVTMARGRPRRSGQDVLVNSADFIGWALGGLEREIAQTRERLSALNAQAVKLRARIGRGASSSTAGSPAREAPASRRQRRRQMSAEARKRMSQMMKKRWAERRKAKG